MQCEIAHAVRGRLRVRYPPAWLGPRRGTLEARVAAVDGVRTVAGSPVTGSVRIEYDPRRLSEGALVAALAEINARLGLLMLGGPPRERPGTRLSRGASLLELLAASSALATLYTGAPLAVGVAVTLLAGVPALARAGRTLLRRRRVNGDVLDATTLLLLALRGQFPAAAVLTWLRSLGDLVVAQTGATARRSLRNLVTPPEQTFWRLERGARTLVALPSLQVGDLIVLSAPRQIPIDGTVVQGEALVDQQTMTGEGLPVERRTGDTVYAATVVEDGEIVVRVDRTGLDTAVGRIVQAIEKMAGEKSDIETFAQRLADREVYRALVLAALGAGFSRSLDAGLSILVADYGLAARVGIPTAITASMTRAARQGILIKGPRVLEMLARVDTVVFDKTGTLTSGMPAVRRVVSYDGFGGDEAVLRLAASAERGFRHPVARAITRAARERGVDVPRRSATRVRVGLGIDAHIEGARVLVGSRRFLEAAGVDVGAANEDERAAHALGASPILVAVDGRLAGALILQDELRADAPEAVRQLRARRMRNVILLSGDHPEPTRLIAESLGLRHHYAELLPEDKAALIRQLKGEGRVVAMVGDGVNDALALSAADVGVAVRGGAEVVTEAADVVLRQGGLDRVVGALDLAQQAVAGIQRTLTVSTRANLAVLGLGALGLARPLPTILISHGAALAAAVSTALWAPAAPRPAAPALTTGTQTVAHTSARTVYKNVR